MTVVPGTAANPTPATLPTWTDPHSVTSYLVSIVGVVFGAIGGTHPGFTEPAWVQAALPIVGLVVAAAAQVVNVVTHRSAHSAVAVVNASQPAPVPATPAAAAQALATAHQALQSAQAAVAAVAPPS